VNGPAWPGGCAGAVSLTFDDALPSQLDTAVPLLEGRNLRATFYVNPNDAWCANAEVWRAVQSRGHEVGNHTISHPCSGNFGWIRTKPLEDMTLDEIEAEVRSGREAIEKALPDQREFSFCYPCYQDFVGRGEGRRSYVPVVARYHRAARGWGESPNDPERVDLHYIWAFPGSGLKARGLIDLCEQATDGRWTVLVFHGLGGGPHPTAPREFRKLCTHLDRNRDRLWTAPLVEVASEILVRRERGPAQVGSTP